MFATGPLSRDFFANWKRSSDQTEKPFAYEEYDDATFRHLVQVSLDDLHVHRLRQLWIDVAHKLGAESTSLKPLYDLEHATATPPPPARPDMRDNPIVIDGQGVRQSTSLLRPEDSPPVAGPG
jgi:hypothetical protein